MLEPLSTFGSSSRVTSDSAEGTRTILSWALLSEHMTGKRRVTSSRFPLRALMFYMQQGGLAYAFVDLLLNT